MMPDRLTLVVALVYACLVSYDGASESCSEYGRATENLREVVIGKCTLFQEIVNNEVFCKEGLRNCTMVWEAFRDAFAFQPKCNVSIDKMASYIALTNHSIPANMNIFWENVYPFISRYTNNGQRYMSISDTLSGYIGDGIQWCSDDKSSTGMTPKGQSCPGFEASPDCYQSAQRAFWIAASDNYAKSATGEVHVLLNASITPIFSLDTYFAVHELPNIPEKNVKKATVLLINQNPIPNRSSCDDPTLSKLAQKFKEKQIQYDCIENRRDVLMTFCLDNPAEKVCEVLKAVTSKSSTNYSSGLCILVWLFGHIVVFFQTRMSFKRQF